MPNFGSMVSNSTEYSFIEKIVVAEDKLINLRIIENQLTELGLKKKSSFTVNGQETINLVKTIVSEAID